MSHRGLLAAGKTIYRIKLTMRNLSSNRIAVSVHPQ